MTTNFPTREDYFQIGASEVFARGAVRPKATRLSPEAVFTEGTDVNIIIAACSAMADEATRHLCLRMAALFLDSASGEDLDRLVADRFSPTVVRRQAAPAVVELEFRRPIPPSSGASVTIPTGAKVRTPQGTEFELTQAASFPSSSTGPITAAARAVQSGTVGNAAAGTITGFVEAPEDPEITVTNPDPASGGTDVETDESLRERARDFFRTARRGTLAAIEFGALTVEGVASATAIELLDNEGRPSGVVQIFIADANGQSNQILADAVRNALLEFRAAGVVVDVITTTPRFEEIAYQLSFRPGTDTRGAVEQLKAITEVSINVLAQGEPLLRSQLFALARSIPGAIVTEDAVVEPTGDIIPDTGEVIKTSLSRITVNGV